MPKSNKDVSLTREEIISNEVNSKDSTHNSVTSIAAAVLIIKLAQEYLFNSAAASSSSASVMRSIRAGDDEYRIDRNIKKYLSRKDSHLDANAREWLKNLLRAGRPVDTRLEKVTLLHRENGTIQEEIWLIPVREVFFIVYMAMIELDENIWPLAKDCDAENERLCRLREFDRVNNALVKAKICETGIRHEWMRCLDGYAGFRLPMNGDDVLFLGLREFVANALEEHFDIRLPEARDPVFQERVPFEKGFKTIFLPWLLEGEMPESLLHHMEEQAAQTYIFSKFESIAIVPDQKMDKKIRKYCSKASFEAMPCDLTPFLATLRSWLNHHALWLLINPEAGGQSALQKLSRQIVDWMRSDAFSMTAVSPGTFDGMQTFYLLERLYHAITLYEEYHSLLNIADLPESKKETWLETLRFLEELINSSELTLENILNDDLLEPRLQAFESGYTLWRQNSYSDFISNFFADWFASEGHLATRANCFTTLMALCFNESSSALPVIYIRDDLLKQWTEKKDEHGLIHLEVYQLNRMLLHALCYPVEQWSSLFCKYFSVLRNFIDADFNEPNTVFKLDLKRDSYPPVLLAQIDRMIADYQNPEATAASSTQSADAKKEVITPGNISSANSVQAAQYMSVASKVPESTIYQVINHPGFDVKACSIDKKQTPLHLATISGNVTVALALIKAGAEINAKDKYNQTPLHLAAISGNVTVALALIKAGAEINAKDKYNQTPISRAISYRQLHFVEWLLPVLANKNILYHLVHNHPFLKKLIKLIPVNLRWEFIVDNKISNRSVLQKAFRYPISLQMLLESLPAEQRIPAIQIKDKLENTLLSRAALSVESLEIILKCIPKEQWLELICTANKNGDTVLHRAVKNPKALRVLLNALPEKQRLGAVQRSNHYNYTVLHLSAHSPDALCMILKSLPDEQRLEAIKRVCNDNAISIRKLVFSPHRQGLVNVESIPDEQRRSLYHCFHSFLSASSSSAGALPENVFSRYQSTVLHMAANTPKSLKTILSLIPEQQRWDALNLLDNEGNTVLSRVDNEDSKAVIRDLLKDCDLRRSNSMENILC